MQYSWTCGCCGQHFSTLPLDYGFDALPQWLDLPEAERSSRATLTPDLCTIDGQQHYIRCCVQLPVHGLNERFVWGIWVSISEQSRKRILELWSVPVPDGEPPRFGWLCTWIGGYPEPVEIKCQIHLQNDGKRPLVELEPTSHPLAVQQREGVTLDWVKDRAAKFGHA